jgi:hypothetical protein
VVREFARTAIAAHGEQRCIDPAALTFTTEQVLAGCGKIRKFSVFSVVRLACE